MISSSIVPTWSLSRAALVAALAACCLGGCAVYDDSPQYAGDRYPYPDPPLYEPEPIFVPGGPPPMLVEVPPPRPFPGAVWLSGSWVWQGRWVWATGRWAERPRPGYAWAQPYYDRRDGGMIFVPGHWRQPGVPFVPPPPSVRGAPPRPTLRPHDDSRPPGRPSWRGLAGQAVPPPVPMPRPNAPATATQPSVPTPGATDGAAPAARREGGGRRIFGSRSDRDKRDPKGD